jgi:hypothetical protein
VLRAIELDKNTEREAPTNYEATEERLAGSGRLRRSSSLKRRFFWYYRYPGKPTLSRGKGVEVRNTIPASTAGIAPRLGFFSSGPAGFIGHPGRVLVVCLMPAG